MKLKSQMALAALTLTIAGASLLGVSSVYAQDSVDGTPTIIQKIAQKFNLNENDVKAVFDQEKTDRQNQMETRFLSQLDQLIKDGKITEAQKQLIVDKRKELATKRSTGRDQLKNMTAEQRKSQMQTEKQALDDWAKQNGIDVKYLFGGFGPKGHWLGHR